MTTSFFKPNTKLVKSIIAHANGRVIMDIGCGESFELIKALHAQKHYLLMGIDLQLSTIQRELFRIQVGMDNFPHLMEWDITKHPQLMQHPRALYIFARPCHSNFVEESIDNMKPGSECLYITLPENLERYDDLGKYQEQAVKIELEGSSVDNEVIYSIIKK